MSTTYHHRSSNPAIARHKRKGVPVRSPCQRDMAESPGVVFRFPGRTLDSSSSSTSTGTIPTGLNILPSSAGLPSGLGAKSVIAAAAQVSHPHHHSTITAPTNNSDCDNNDHLTAHIDSAQSTPILKPATAAPIHRSASNVLHYPELLTDLRDRLVQTHRRDSGTRSASSGADSDVPDRRPSRRTRTTKRAAGPAKRRSGLRGESMALRSRSETEDSPDPGSSSHPKTPHAEDDDEMHRRHSISALHGHPAEDDEEVNIMDEWPAATTRSSQPPNQVATLPSAGQLAAHTSRPLPFIPPSAGSSHKRKRKVDPTPSLSSSGQHPYKRPGVLNPNFHGSVYGVIHGRRTCGACGATSSPCWRHGLIENMTLCNQCGLRFKKGKVYCPNCCYVPTKTEIATGGARLCVRCNANMPLRPVPTHFVAHSRSLSSQPLQPSTNVHF